MFKVLNKYEPFLTSSTEICKYYLISFNTETEVKRGIKEHELMI